MRDFSLAFQEFYSRFIHTPSKTNKNFAVVFSSSQLLDSGLGEKIDSFDRVMRFNFAPTIGFEKDVGAKTTHRIMQPNVRFREKNEECFSYDGYNLLSVKSHLRDAQLWKQRTYTDFYEHFHLISHHMLIPSFDFVAKIVEEDYQYFSTGLWGLFYAIACSEKPTLFGWENWNERTKSTKDYYFNTLQVVEKNPHFLEESRKILVRRFNRIPRKNMEELKRQEPNFLLEKKIILTLEQLKLITIHRFN